MDKPLCRVCNTRHWGHEDHTFPWRTMDDAPGPNPADYQEDVPLDGADESEVRSDAWLEVGAETEAGATGQKARNDRYRKRHPEKYREYMRRYMREYRQR